MRSFTAAILMGTLITGMYIGPAHAAGNVLLPSSDNSDSDAPNLGLGPSSSSSGSSAPSPTPIPPTPAPPATQAVPPSPSTAALPYTPALPFGTGAPSAVTSSPGTTVMQYQNLPTISPSMTAGLPNSFTVDINSQWNPAFISRVNTQLGIPSDKVPSVCQIGVAGMIASDKGMLPFESNQSTHAVAKYAGHISGLIVAAKAYCKAVYPLPPNRGSIPQYGGIFMINLGLGPCTPTGPVSKVVVSSDETGKLQCKF